MRAVPISVAFCNSSKFIFSGIFSTVDLTPFSIITIIIIIIIFLSNKCHSSSVAGCKQYS